MIPSYIYQVTEIPITSNGKIDKKKLREYNKPIRNSSLEFPVTASELKISKICENIFGIDGIGVDEDFFVLGCNSLKALQLTNRIFQDFGIKVKIEAVFMHSTIKDLAEHIDGKAKEEDLLPETDERNIIEI
jgi:acyl carrier protein